MKQNCCQNYNKKTCTKVVITDLSNRYHYYQWFIYGMQKLSRNGEIEFKYKIPFLQRIATIDNSSLLVRIVNNIKYKLFGNIEIKTKAYLKGYIEKDGKRHTFCIDSADSPNMFNGELLRDVDCYFKIQCPKEFDKRGFKIGNVYIPFFDVHFLHEEDNGKRKGARKLCPEAYQFNNKIKPLFLAVRSMGRTAAGVRGINLRDNDYVVGSDILEPDSEVLVISEKGYGKRTAASEYPVKGRGGKGIKTANITEKNGPLAGVTVVNGDEDIMLITSAGVMIRFDVDDVSQTGRATLGVRLIKVDDGAQVASITAVPKASDEDEESTAEEEPVKEN